MSKSVRRRERRECTDMMDDIATWMEHAESDRYVPSLSQVNGLQEVCGSGGESGLNKEARKWASKVAKDYKIISHGTRVDITEDLMSHLCDTITASNIHD